MTLDAGHLTWVLTSAALVLFMTPGLAFFYGGMDGSRNVLNMLMMNFYCVLVVPVLWVAVGYSLAQVPLGGDVIGSFDAFFLKDITEVGDGSSLATVGCREPADRLHFAGRLLLLLGSDAGPPT